MVGKARRAQQRRRSVFEPPARRNEIRKIKNQGGLPPGGIVVEIHGGDYFVASPLALTAEDSGVATRPSSIGPVRAKRSASSAAWS